jgi:hypothetical protein
MVTLLVLVAFPARVQAQTTRRDSTILLTIAASPTEAEKLGAVARELLARLEMQVELRGVPRIDVGEIREPVRREPAYFARVWVAFGTAGGARLYLEHAARDRVLVRDVADDAHNPELVREELGHILQTALEGLKAGEEIGAPRDEALKQVEAEELAAKTPTPPTPPSAGIAANPVADASALAPPPRRLRFGPRYEVVWLGDGGHFEDGPGAVLGVKWAQRWGVELGAFFRRPLKVQATPVGARLQSFALNALVSFEAWRSARACVRLAAGAQVELVHVSPFTAAGNDARVAKSHWLTLALGRLGLTYAHDVGDFMDLEITLGAELDPSGTRYVFQRSSGDVDVLSPWPVRPLLSLGATVP